MIIAIDGTLASGKGTIARRLADIYGLPHLDTGLLYRAVGMQALDQDIALDNATKLAAAAGTIKAETLNRPELRSPQAAEAASKVAVIPAVRDALFQLQRSFAQQPGGAILDGRDIGSVICPDADIKLWIDAAIEVRARRRMLDFADQGNSVGLPTMIAGLEDRDKRDRNRSQAPMVKAADAILIDTSSLSIDAAVDKARSIIERKFPAKP
ncbi:MAG: cytidylate kinase [Hyphomonadaceae bacterium]|nr:cytidylate kinase [Hyphomonadaceae bacterium]OUX94600.1 MAG: cytidylate kinase [Hyphomonas sp. TMED17]CAI8341897.1 MAG: Cytidylate kinase [Hyphomonas sp. TMED17]